MIDRESLARALSAGRGGITLHAGTCTETIGPRGGRTVRREEWRSTGALKTWKTDATRYRLPLKHGMRDYGEITPDNAHLFHWPNECPVKDGQNA
jgi:hypothetical protein